MTDTLCECGGKGEVPVTPGLPGDGSMACPSCSPNAVETARALLAGGCSLEVETVCRAYLWLNGQVYGDA